MVKEHCTLFNYTWSVMSACLILITVLLFLSVAMRSFVAHCPELLTEDVIRRLMTPIECAMTMMSQ